jgi:SAM-dependent methyltransferase
MIVARIEPFDEFPQEYEKWFEVNRFVYESEMQAVRAVLPKADEAVDVGVGSGRFAGPLGIKRGVEPSAAMRTIARTRGIEAIDGVAESLPYEDGTLDLVLMVTTLCFLDDINAAFKEVVRVLKREGCFVIGFVDRESPIGQRYERNKDANPFYKIATFYSVPEVIEHLKNVGFGCCQIVQTVFHDLEEITEIESVEDGYGNGSFVVIRATRLDNIRS